MDSRNYDEDDAKQIKEIPKQQSSAPLKEGQPPSSGPDPEDHFQDGCVISKRDYPVFNKIMRAQADKQRATQARPMDISESLGCLQEANDWNNKVTDQMNLQNKDIFVVIGPSRSGKGTLLSALLGNKMKYFSRKNVKGEMGKSVAVAHFLAPVAEDGETAVASDIVSHERNSHTLRPKIVGNGHYIEEYAQLEGTLLVDFPGIFESKGIELDISMHLALQRLMIAARSVKVLVMVSALSLTPDQSQIIELILEELNLMFKDPHEHLVIGITKARLADNIIPEEEILDVASGSMGEESLHRSFKGYTCIRIEQDDIALNQAMIAEVFKKGNVKNFVKMGFIQSSKIEEIFDKVRPTVEIKAMAITEWIDTIDGIFSHHTIEIDFDQEKTFQAMSDALNSDELLSNSQRNEILRQLGLLNLKQAQKRDQWLQIASPTYVRTILGLLPKYRAVDRILAQSDNCAVRVGLYKADMQTLEDLRKVILLIRQDHIEELGQSLENSKQFMGQLKYLELQKKCAAVKEKIKNDIEDLQSVDPAEITTFQSIVSTLGVSVKFIGVVGKGIYNAAVSLHQRIKKGNEHYTQMKKFQNEIQTQLVNYIEMELQAIEDSLASYQTRLGRTKGIIDQNRRRISMSYEEVQAQELKYEADLLQDHVQLAKDKKAVDLLLRNEKGEYVNDEFRFTSKYFKVNRQLALRERIIVLTKYKIFIVSRGKNQSQPYKINYQLRIDQVKALSKIQKEDDHLSNPQFLLHVHDDIDQVMLFNNDNFMAQAFNAIKFSYWKLIKFNVPVFLQAEEVVKKGKYTTKRMHSNGKAFPLPSQKMRLANEDTYFEDPRDAEEARQERKNTIRMQLNEVQTIVQPSLDRGISSESIARKDGEMRQFIAQNGSDAKQLKEDQEKRLLNIDGIVNFTRGGNVKLSEFDLKVLIGQGSFAKVFLVQHVGTENVYAMKILKKKVLIELESVEMIKQEQKVLEVLDSPWLVRLEHSFQNDYKIYFVIEFVRGGELFTLLTEQKKFSESRTKFYCVQIALALGYLHEKGMLYRDLKPENILIDEHGYLKLTDFGLCAPLTKGGKRRDTFCGTKEYMSPEMVRISGYSIGLDWWALGIMCYEMICGYPPFSTHKAQWKEIIQNQKLFFPDQNINNIDMSDECKDFITQLLVKQEENRLGSQGDMDEVLSHAWFKDLDIESIKNKTMPAEYVPILSDDPLDVQNFDNEFTYQEARHSILENDEIQAVKGKESLFNFAE